MGSLGLGKGLALAALAIAAKLCLTGLPAAATELAGSEWRPVQIGETAIPEDAEMFLRFAADGQLNGHGGCNGFFGSYEVAGGKLVLGQMGVTQMACPEEIMRREQLFLRALGQAKGYSRDRTTLLLQDGAGTTLISLRQTDWD